MYMYEACGQMLICLVGLLFSSVDCTEDVCVRIVISYRVDFTNAVYTSLESEDLLVLSFWLFPFLNNFQLFELAFCHC